MVRTALELTNEELETYQPGRRQKEKQIDDRWEKGWEVARMAADLLRKRFGATQVLAFGSIIHREGFTPWSDIDIVAFGIPAREFYRAVAAITGLSSEFKIDLIDTETCRPGLMQLINREGVDL